MSRPPLCIACNYALTGLHEPRCPECGRAFDPADPRTFNAGGAVGKLGRGFLRPAPMLVLLLAATGLAFLLYATPLPGRPWMRSMAEYRIYRGMISEITNGPSANAAWEQADRPFLLGVAAVALAAAWMSFREVMRLGVLLVRRPGRALRGRPWPRRAMLLVLLAAAAWLIMAGWPVRLATLAARTEYVTPSPGWRTLSVGERTRMFQAGLHEAREARTRFLALVRLLHERPGELHADVRRAIERERDPDLLSALIHVAALARDAEAEPLLLQRLDHPEPCVRAPAADALGMIYRPPYEVDSADDPQLETPWQPVDVRPLLAQGQTTVMGKAVAWAGGTPKLDTTPRPMPPAIRARLERAMLEGPTSVERHAAARSLIHQPPEGYRLRYAEWGVWLSAGSELHVLREVLDSMPAFVHRVGEKAEAFAERIRPEVYISNKPVIHLTADRPLAVDVEIAIRRGRPLFAYPRPDDVAVATEQLTGPWTLGALDAQGWPALGQLREGYPWLAPHHRRHGGGNVERGWLPGVSEPAFTQISGLGLHWQDLIVSPAKLPWMAPPEVEKEAQFAWWEALRAVPSAYVSSRGEAERFLYYDGPSLLGPPVRVEPAEGGNLLLTQRRPVAMDFPAHLAALKRVHGQRVGISIEVKAGRPMLWSRRLAEGTPESPRTLAFEEGVGHAGEAAAEAHLMTLLGEAGLTREESAGLLACWRDMLLRRDGRRFVLLLTTLDYEELAPLTIAPLPTEAARVGLVLTELGTQPAPPRIPPPGR